MSGMHEGAGSRSTSSGRVAFMASRVGRLGLLVAAGLLATTIGCGSHGCSLLSKGDHAMNNSSAESILKRLEKTGKLDGVEIEHYVGGGMPPPFLHNDQLRFHTHEGREIMEFAKSNFKRTEFNPAALDIYQLPADPADVRIIARLILAADAFGAGNSQGTKKDVADIIRTEIVVTEGGDEAKRVYYGHLPEALGPLEKEVEALIERLKAKGEYGLYADERKVPGAVRP